MALAKVLTLVPRPSGLPEILTVAHALFSAIAEAGCCIRNAAGVAASLCRRGCVAGVFKTGAPAADDIIMHDYTYTSPPQCRSFWYIRSCRVSMNQSS